MVALVDVGVSPVLRVPQFIDARGVPNLVAFRRAFESWFGIPLNVTEGARSRARQDMLWADWRRYVTYGGAWAPRAAIPYTSIHDEVTRALAVDLGSGLAVAGTPQAIWARANGPKYGVHPTGYSFDEPWHYDIRPGTETITLASLTGTQIGDDDMPTAQEIAQAVWTHQLAQTSGAKVSGRAADWLVNLPDQFATPAMVKQVRDDINYISNVQPHSLKAIHAAASGGSSTTAGAPDLAPILEAIRALPAETVAALKAAL